LDPRFELFWSVNSSDATIHVAARAQTAGWLAIGISEIGSMVGSDALVAWVAETEGRVYATDRFIFDKSGPALDAQQDWHVLGGSQATNQSTGDTWTTVHAWRKLDTGDCNDRPIVPGKLHNLIWAIGSTDDVSYHGSTRGGSSLLLAPAPGPSILSPRLPPRLLLRRQLQLRLMLLGGGREVRGFWLDLSSSSSRRACSNSQSRVTACRQITPHTSARWWTCL
ncbi:hypothetical protein CLOM_g138, partial [Closterium sp. NIES-68]